MISLQQKDFVSLGTGAGAGTVAHPSLCVCMLGSAAGGQYSCHSRLIFNCAAGVSRHCRSSVLVVQLLVLVEVMVMMCDVVSAAKGLEFKLGPIHNLSCHIWSKMRIYIYVSLTNNAKTNDKKTKSLKPQNKTQAASYSKENLRSWINLIDLIQAVFSYLFVVVGCWLYKVQSTCFCCNNVNVNVRVYCQSCAEVPDWG